MRVRRSVDCSVFASVSVVVVLVPLSTSVLIIIVWGSFCPKPDKIKLLLNGLKLQIYIPSIVMVVIFVTGGQDHVIDDEVTSVALTGILSCTGITQERKIAINKSHFQFVFISKIS
jgi:hypothetical protein